MIIVASIPYPHISPVLFRVGPLAVRWYGLAYLLGFLLAYLALRRMIRARVLDVTVEALSDPIGWLMVGVMIGGRTGWWLFYHRGGASEPWYEPFAVWHGGMNFHGGLLGVAILLTIWAWLRGAPPWNLADGAALVAPIGLFLGRLANFINAELVGRPTGVPWGIVFPGDIVARHPSQLYEALLEGPLLLALLWIVLLHYRPRPGRIAALFIIFYSLFRFGVEFTRQPDGQLGFIAFGWLTMGQLLSAILAAAAGIGLWRMAGRSSRRQQRNNAALSAALDDTPYTPTGI